MHLSKSSPSPDLLDYLQKLSFENLIKSMHIYLPTILHRWSFYSKGVFPKLAWENIFDFVTATEALVC